MKTWVQNRLRHLIYSFLFLLCACQSQSSANSAAPAEFRIKAKQTDLKVELALTNKQWMKGLMRRESLEKNSGMLFVGRKEERRSFWMKNTYISLDIIYLDSSRKIVNVVKGATPLSEAPLWSAGPAQFVLELQSGMADQLQLQKGDQLDFDTEIIKKSEVD